MPPFAEITVTLTFNLSADEMDKLAEFIDLRRKYDAAARPAHKYPDSRYTDEACLSKIIQLAVGLDIFDAAIRHEQIILQHRLERGPIPEPAPEQEGV